MSLRDFNNTPASDDPIALHNEPLGNGAGLSDFHTVNVEEREISNTPKIVGAVAVALMVGAAAVGFYGYSGSSPHAVVAENTPAKTAPVAPVPQQTAMAPADNMTAAPDASAPQPVAAPEAPKPAPVRTASIRSSRSNASADATAQARMAAARPSTQVPEPAQVTPVQEQAQAAPLPTPPNPSPSDVASNGAAAAPEVSPAPQQLQSSTPQADNAAPAQDQQSGATPAPAQ